MAIKIVTAKKGEPHITSSDDGAMHQGIFGTDDYVLNVGEKFRAELVSNNEVKIYDGEGMMQGRHWRIEPGTYESLTIDNGSQGMKRKDLIVARYTKDSGSGVENIELAVLKGTETEENAIAPVPETGDIRNGDLQHEMILYTATLDGLNVTAVDVGYITSMSTADIEKKLQYKMHVSSFQTGAALNTDYKIPIPEELKGKTGYLLANVMVSNTPGAFPEMSSFYDIHYIGTLKTNGTYQITNAACTNKSARAIWVYW